MNLNKNYKKTNKLDIILMLIASAYCSILPACSSVEEVRNLKASPLQHNGKHYPDRFHFAQSIENNTNNFLKKDLNNLKERDMLIAQSLLSKAEIAFLERAINSIEKKEAYTGYYMNVIGGMYESGQFGDENCETASRWFIRAALLDETEALTNLAVLINKGFRMEGVPSDFSHLLLQYASDKGDKRAGELLE